MIALNLIFIFTLPASTPISIVSIPQNEYVAEKMVRQGKLDVALWEMIKPYYAQPIDVPNGELNILLEMFPQLPETIPVNCDSLKKYLPWNENAKNLFFNDFPFLIQFLPILRFDIRNSYSRIKADFSISGKDISKPFSHGANLSVRLSQKTSFESRINFTDDYARWYRRRIVIKPSEKFHLQLGNFGSFFDKGLFLGFFPSIKSNQSTSLENWIYGDAPNWNGIKLQLSDMGSGFFKKVGITTFFHKRFSELSFGSFANYRINQQIQYSAGVSSLFATDSVFGATEHYYLHSALRIKINRFTSELQTGIDFDEPCSVPLYLESKIGNSDKELAFFLIVLPRNFNAPNSYVCRKLKVDPVEINSTLFSVSVQSKYHAFAWFSLLPLFDAVFEEDRLKESRLKLSCTGVFGHFLYDIGCSWMPACGQSDTTDVSLSSILQLEYSKKVSIISEFEALSLNRFGYNITGTIHSKLDFFSALSFNPSISFTTTNSECTKVTYGIQQILCIGDKTFTEIQFEKPLKTKKKGEFVSVKAKASFVF